MMDIPCDQFLNASSDFVYDCYQTVTVSSNSEFWEVWYEESSWELSSTCGWDELNIVSAPSNTAHSNGTPFSKLELETMRSAQWKHCRAIQWKKGDLLVGFISFHY